METLGDRIKQLIKGKGLSQKAVAKAIGMTELTLGRIIRNEVEAGYLKVKIIADFLNADLNWLITGQTLEQRQGENIHIHHINQKDIGRDATLHIGYKIALSTPGRIKEKEEIILTQEIIQFLQIIQQLNPEQRQKLLRLIHEIFDLNINP